MNRVPSPSRNLARGSLDGANRRFVLTLFNFLVESELPNGRALEVVEGELVHLLADLH